MCVILNRYSTHSALLDLVGYIYYGFPKQRIPPGIDALLRIETPYYLSRHVST